MVGGQQQAQVQLSLYQKRVEVILQQIAALSSFPTSLLPIVSGYVTPQSPIFATTSSNGIWMLPSRDEYDVSTCALRWSWSWRPIHRSAATVSYANVITHIWRQRLYVIRGSDLQMRMFTPINDIWTEVAPVTSHNQLMATNGASLTMTDYPRMIHSRQGCSSVICRDKLYVFGGLVKGTSLRSSTVEYWDLIGQNWYSLTETMSRARVRTKVVVWPINHQIFLFGGDDEGDAGYGHVVDANKHAHNSSSISLNAVNPNKGGSTIERFDPTTGLFTIIHAEALFHRYLNDDDLICFAVPHLGGIVMLPSKCHTNDAIIYDPLSNTTRPYRVEWPSLSTSTPTTTVPPFALSSLDSFLSSGRNATPLYASSSPSSLSSSTQSMRCYTIQPDGDGIVAGLFVITLSHTSSCWFLPLGYFGHDSINGQHWCVLPSLSVSSASGAYLDVA
jgi:hypothetical protein